MNVLLWLSVHALLSVACDISYGYAEWTPRENDTLSVDVIPLVPDVSTELFEKLNPGVNPGMLFYDITSPYRLPYHPSMTIISPAILSGDCPKTLLLDRTGKAQSTLSNSRKPMASATTASGPELPEITSMVTANSETINTGSTRQRTKQDSSKHLVTFESLAGDSTTESHSASEPSEDDPSSVTTHMHKTFSPRTTSNGKTGETISPTGNKSPPTAFLTTTSTSHTETGSQTAMPENSLVEGALVCDDDNGSAASKETWMEYRRSFCDEFKNIPFTKAEWKKDWGGGEISLGLHFSRYGRSCNEYEINDMTCEAYLQKIENTCLGYGGNIWSDCFLVWASVSGSE